MSKQQEGHSPRDDDHHDEHGRHRTEPPPGWQGTRARWAQLQRTHEESNALARYVRTLLAG